MAAPPDCASCRVRYGAVNVRDEELIGNDRAPRSFGNAWYCNECLSFKCAACDRYGLNTTDNEYYAFKPAPGLGSGALVCGDCADPCVQCGELMNGHADADRIAHVGCMAAYESKMHDNEESWTRMMAANRARHTQHRGGN
jgi:hypothetical protein